MAKLKIIPIALMTMCAFLVAVQPAQSQCDTTDVTIGTVTIDPCNPQRLNIPVYMNNPCPVGGIQFHIYTTERAWLHFTPGDPNCADTIGSRIGEAHWEYFSANVHPGMDSVIWITGIAVFAPGGQGEPLPPGDGLIFTMHLDYRNYLVCDSSQTIAFDDSISRVVDPTGYISYDLRLNPGNLFVLPGRCNGNPRGDANCSGFLTGLDVVYLVSFLKGQGPSFCCLCSGDANSSGSVTGLDVTFLINYLKGGLVPGPCN